MSFPRLSLSLSSFTPGAVFFQHKFQASSLSRLNRDTEQTDSGRISTDSHEARVRMHSPNELVRWVALAFILHGSENPNVHAEMTTEHHAQLLPFELDHW